MSLVRRIKTGKDIIAAVVDMLRSEGVPPDDNAIVRRLRDVTIDIAAEVTVPNRKPPGVADWIQEAVNIRADRLIVAKDGFSHEAYPIYVMPGEDVAEIRSRLSGGSSVSDRVLCEYDLTVQYRGRQ